MYHSFSIAETLSTAWKVLKKNFITVMVYSAITFTLLAILSLINELVNINGEITVLSVVLFFIVMLIQAYTTLGLYKLTFILMDSEYYEFELSQVFPKFTMVVSFITISLLTATVFVSIDFVMRLLLKHHSVGLNIAEFTELVILLYLAVRYLFCICFIVDDHSGPIEALGQSFRLTHGYIPKILLLLLISLALIAVGYALPQKLGIILTYPLVNTILMVAYRKLVYSHKDVDDLVSETV